MECRSRNNGMLRNDTHTDLGTGLHFVTFSCIELSVYEIVQGYRNGYPFPEGENIVLGEMDLFLED